MKTTELIKIFVEAFDFQNQVPPLYVSTPLSLQLNNNQHSIVITLAQHITLIFGLNKPGEKTVLLLNNSEKTNLLNPDNQEITNSILVDLYTNLSQNNQFNRFLLYHDYPSDFLQAQEIQRLVDSLRAYPANSNRKNENQNDNEKIKTLHETPALLVVLSESKYHQKLINFILNQNVQLNIYRVLNNQYPALIADKKLCIEIGQKLSCEKSLTDLKFELYLSDII